ncbi:acyl-CoA dehydrogenase family protein [Saccharothrix sp.]|uniref:acyl-CoA dehydrogenase family protein n=1 Tax=Saccharothrix sp. TaxID=1873460 RepID=UPI0028112DE9|nr:acyl-CoA dehydrogenase family protein [Saccharothrix sp.]
MTVTRPSFGKELFRGRLRLDLFEPPAANDLTGRNSGDRHLKPLAGQGLTTSSAGGGLTTSSAGEGQSTPPALDGQVVPLVGGGLTAEEKIFLQRIKNFCELKVSGAEIEREDRIPDDVVDGLRDLGAFAIKLPREYGGLGLSNLCYLRALMLVGSAHSSLGELLAAHQAIGLTQPLLLFGTDEQKRDLLPRCAREISAFTLTEPDIGNDPFRMRTTATPTDDGGYVLNGLKLWVTNGTIADLLVVMAMVPPTADRPGGMSAFVVEADAPGLTVEHRSSFLGLKGLENGVVRLHDVRIPENRRIGPEGQGLEVALAAQDTGRLSLPAVCAAAAKWSLKIAREWSRVRVQWDKPIGAHEAVAAKVAFIAATAFALESIVEVTGRRADAGADTRAEAELAKLFASEQTWRVADELVQVRGGRGYETAESAAARGERGVPVEQLLRDVRIGRIFDGSTEALRVFIASDALGDSDIPDEMPTTDHDFGELAGHMAFAADTCRELARHLERGRKRWGERILERQLFVGRVVDIAAELYAMTVSCAHARSLGGSAVELADAFCGQSRRRIARLWDRLWVNTDERDAALAARVLDDAYTWLEDGVLDPSTEGPWIAEVVPGPSTTKSVRRVRPVRHERG